MRLVLEPGCVVVEASVTPIYLSPKLRPSCPWASCSFGGDPEGLLGNRRKLRPFAPVQCPSTEFWSQAAPLLEKEGDPGPGALVADVAHPLRIHGAGPGATLAAHDDPMNADEIERAEGRDQRLDGEEAHAGRRLLQVPNARQLRTVLNRHPKPHVRGPAAVAVASPQKVAHQRRALG